MIVYKNIIILYLAAKFYKNLKFKRAYKITCKEKLVTSMKIRNLFILSGLIAVISISISCQPDDPTFIPVPDRDRTEQQLADKDSLINYFDTHYYNSGSFVAGMDYTVDDIIITELPQDENGNYLPLPDPDNNTILSESPLLETHTVTFEETLYEYYILRLNQGGGAATPNFTDKVRVVYEGSLVENGEVFDNAVSPTVFDLIGVGIGTGVIKGWREILTQFNVASSFVSNGDGTVSYSDYGFGVMFIPSGLAYFSSAPVGIPVYSNLVFKFELLQTEINDHDNDGVPSHLEDLDMDLDVFDDDTDEDNLANYIDVDDDGDGVRTINEDLNNDGDPTNDDSDEDGIPNYLDEDSTESNQES